MEVLTPAAAHTERGRGAVPQESWTVLAPLMLCLPRGFQPDPMRCLSNHKQPRFTSFSPQLEQTRCCCLTTSLSLWRAQTFKTALPSSEPPAESSMAERLASYTLQRKCQRMGRRSCLHPWGKTPFVLIPQSPSVPESVTFLDRTSHGHGPFGSDVPSASLSILRDAILRIPIRMAGQTGFQAVWHTTFN